MGTGVSGKGEKCYLTLLLKKYLKVLKEI